MKAICIVKNLQTREKFRETLSDSEGLWVGNEYCGPKTDGYVWRIEKIVKELQS